MENATRKGSRPNAKLACLLVALFATLSLAAAGFPAGNAAVAQDSSGAEVKEVKIVRVTAETIARLPRGENFVVDLTGGGITYDIGPVDRSRVRVKTGAGELTLDEHFKEALGRKVEPKSRRHVLGATEGIIKAFNLAPPVKPGTGYMPGGGKWHCYDNLDCVGMFSAGLCKDDTADCQQAPSGVWLCSCSPK